jgi:endonuclease/exonuclease/phosphatase family metal-dependent hydrolase
MDMGDADVVCLQEVSTNMELPDGSTTDQVQELSSLFKVYAPFFGVAVDRLAAKSGRRAQYGNLILSRYPVQTVFHHSLPQPADGLIKQMPRQMVEVVVKTPSRLLRVMTTHLEYHSAVQRIAQTKRIMKIQAEVGALEVDPPLAQLKGPYSKLQRPSACVLCGDFNFLPDSTEYQLVTEPELVQYKLIDAWTLTNAGEPHLPTCGIHDKTQWPQGQHCRDFIFIAPELADAVMGMSIDTITDASDHQPLMLGLQN